MAKPLATGVVTVGVFTALDNGKLLLNLIEAFAHPYAPEWVILGAKYAAITFGAVLVLRVMWLLMRPFATMLRGIGTAFAYCGVAVEYAHHEFGRVMNNAVRSVKSRVRAFLERIIKRL